MIKYWKSYIALFLVLFIHQSVPASVIEVNGQALISLREKTLVLPDFNNVLSPDQIEATPFEYNFKTLNELSSNEDNTSLAYWIKLEITNVTNTPQAYILECYDPKVDQIQIFRNVNGRWKPWTFGAKHPFKDKILKHKNFHLPIVFKPEQKETIYIKMKSDRRISFKWVLKTYEGFTNYAIQEYTSQGFLVGFIVMLVIFNLMMYIASKEKVYISFIFFVFSSLLYILSINGIGFQYLWPGIPGFNTYASGLFSVLMCVGLYLHVNSFFNLKEKDTIFMEIFKWGVYLRVGLFLVGFFIHPLLYDARFELFTFIMALVVGVNNYNKKNRSDLFFITALYVITFALLIHTLWIHGYVDILFPFIERHIYYVYALSVGILIELCLFTAAIAYQIKQLADTKVSLQNKLVEELKEKEQLTQKVNRELEGLVKQRTEELDEKNKKLEELIEITNKFNIQLDKENRDLNKTLKEQNKKKILLSDDLVPFEEFKMTFPTKVICLQLLEGLKWKEGFQCKKCGHTKYKEADKDLSRKCNSCYHVESVTVNTLFHRLRFPIQTAFYMVYLISVKNKVTIDELEEITGLRRATVWSFKKKVMLAIDYWINKKSKPYTWEELILTPVNKLINKKKTT